METRRMVRARRAGASRRSVKLPVAVFVATAASVVAMMAATSLVADAQEAGGTITADSDGNVSVSSVCFGAEQYATGGQYAQEEEQQQYVGAEQYASDGYTGPQYATDQYDAGAQYASGGQYTSEQLAVYNWYNDGYATYGTISIDDCALDAMGAGPGDRERVLAHERGHANGLPHSDDPNDIMYPVVSITGS